MRTVTAAAVVFCFFLLITYGLHVPELLYYAQLTTINPTGAPHFAGFELPSLLFRIRLEILQLGQNHLIGTVILALIGGLSYGLSAMIHRPSATSPEPSWLVPALTALPLVCCFMLLGLYVPSTLDLMLGQCLMLGLLLACQGIPARFNPIRIVVFLACTLILIFISPIQLMAFLGLSALFEFARSRKLALVYAMGEILAVWLAYQLPGMTGPEFSAGAKPVQQVLILLFVLGPLLVALLLLGLLAGPMGRFKPAPPTTFPIITMISPLLVVLLVASAGSLLVINADTRTQLQIRLYELENDPQNLLATARKLKKVQVIDLGAINRALGQTQRISYELFSYPQQSGLVNWLPLSDTLPIPLMQQAAACMIEIGHVNKAERMAQEYSEFNGNQPETVHLLATIYLLKHQNNAARVYLNALLAYPQYSAWAKRYLDLMVQDPHLTSDAYIQKYRALMITSGQWAYTDHETILQQSLQSNPANRLAFDYLMAYYLLTMQLDKMKENMGRMAGLGYTELPRHYEEALLLYYHINKLPPAPPAVGSLHPKALLRFNEFNDIVRKANGNMKLAQQNALPGFGDTYWFYFAFGQSGSAWKLDITSKND